MAEYTCLRCNARVATHANLRAVVCLHGSGLAETWCLACFNTHYVPYAQAHAHATAARNSIQDAPAEDPSHPNA